MRNYPVFNRNLLKVQPLADRIHDLDVSSVKGLGSKAGSGLVADFKEVAKVILRAKNKETSIVMMIGAHVIRSGVQRHIIDLMERGLISCIAMNGAGIIHDFELAFIGATTESVAKYIQQGQFGLWQETGKINGYINCGYKNNLGIGESVGRAIHNGRFPYKDISLLAAGFRLRVPVTVHVGIGYDIIHEHPNCNGAATGAASYRDFLIFTKILERLEGGVVMNFGSAVMAPEVFLKALSMARNVARQKGKEIKDFTALVCDLYELPDNFELEPDKKCVGYYFRPWKTMLVRTVSEGGRSFYIKGAHAQTVPALWKAINEAEKN
jgi:hypothetical protein